MALLPKQNSSTRFLRNFGLFLCRWLIIAPLFFTLLILQAPVPNLPPTHTKTRQAFTAMLTGKNILMVSRVILQVNELQSLWQKLRTPIDRIGNFLVLNVKLCVPFSWKTDSERNQSFQISSFCYNMSFEDKINCIPYLQKKEEERKLQWNGKFYMVSNNLEYIIDICNGITKPYKQIIFSQLVLARGFPTFAGGNNAICPLQK